MQRGVGFAAGEGARLAAREDAHAFVVGLGHVADITHAMLQLHQVFGRIAELVTYECAMGDLAS